MPGRLSSLSITPEIEEYAQGAAQDALQPTADFVAPTVEVPSASSKYKRYTSKNRFHLPDTRRAIGGRAATIQFDRDDVAVDCDPHALDAPLDELELAEMSEADIRAAAEEVAAIGGLSHEKDVLDIAVAAAGSGTTLAVGANDNVIDQLDAVGLAVMKAAKYGSAMGIRWIWGANFWKTIKNNASVKGLYVVGNARKSGVAQPVVETFGELLIGNPQVKVSYMVFDDAAEGVAEDIKFILDKSALCFACLGDKSTRRDPGFMKTFRLRGQWMKPRVYDREDGRGKVFGFDWSCKPQVTNSAAVVRLNVT